MCVFTLGKAKYPKNQNDFTIKCHSDILQHGFYSATLQPDCPIGKACWELFCVEYVTHPDGQMQSNKDVGVRVVLLVYPGYGDGFSTLDSS